MFTSRTPARCPKRVTSRSGHRRLRQEHAISAEDISAEDEGNRPGRAAGRPWPVYLGIVIVLDILLGAGALGVAARAPQAHQTPLQVVRVAAGPEDQPFFEDPRVRAEFARNRLRVVPTYLGSGDMPALNFREYDAVFPSSSVLAGEVQQRLSQGVHPVIPFGTQLVVLTWQKFVPLLRELGIVGQNGTFDVGRYLDVAREGVTWNSIRGNNVYPSPDQVQIEMTDPRYSNSGAMFVAVASYVLNHDHEVSGPGQVKPIAENIAKFLSGLGELQGTSELFYDEYLTDKAPMVVSYESYFLGAKLSDPTELPVGATMLYLDSPIDSDHTILPLTSAGDEFATLMQSDPTLQSIAENDYGFRTTDASVPFAQVMARHGITVPADYPIPPPTTAVLEDLVNAIEAQLSS